MQALGLGRDEGMSLQGNYKNAKSPKFYSLAAFLSLSQGRTEWFVRLQGSRGGKRGLGQCWYRNVYVSKYRQALSTQNLQLRQFKISCKDKIVLITKRYNTKVLRPETSNYRTDRNRFLKLHNDCTDRNCFLELHMQ